MSRRRAALDFSASQTGDVRTRDAVGGNVSHGVDPVATLNLMQHIFDSLQQQQAHYDELERQIDRIRDAVELYRESQRQHVARIDGVLQSIIYWCIGLIAAWIVGFGLLVWLIVDSAVALSLAGIVAGAGTATAALWRLGR